MSARQQVPLSPALLIAAANAFVSAGEIRSKAAADAAFVHYVGRWSHYDERCRRSTWPLPDARTVEELAQFADTSGALRKVPLVGDLMLTWDARARAFGKVAIIVEADRYIRRADGDETFPCAIIEGVLDGEGRKSAVIAVRGERRLSPERGDRVIRWTVFDGREERREMIDREVDRLAEMINAA